MSCPAPPDIVIIDDDQRRAQWLRESRPLAGRETLVVGWGPEIRPLIRLLAPQLIVAGMPAHPAEPHATIRTLRDDGYLDPILVLGNAREHAASDRLRSSGATEYVDVTSMTSVDAHLTRYLPVETPDLRAQPAAARFVHFESAVVDLAESTVVRGGKKQRLSPTEFALFEALRAARGDVVSRAALRATVWTDRPPASRVVDRHISSLRRRLERDPRRPKHLHTVFGEGYRLET